MPRLQLPRDFQGYGLYIEFRPDVDGWGKKAELKCSSILDLRRFLTHHESGPSSDQNEFEGREVEVEVEGVEGPKEKKVRVNESRAEEVGDGKDEFDALLDDDDDGEFDLVDL
jgi:hypothetical protein